MTGCVGAGWFVRTASVFAFVASVPELLSLALCFMLLARPTA
jgi:hypothetical protein